MPLSIKKAILLAIALVIGWLSVADAQVSRQQFSNQTYCSNGKAFNGSAIKPSITEVIRGRPLVTKLTEVKAIRTSGLEIRPSTIAVTLGSTSVIKRLEQMEQAAGDLVIKLFA